MENFKGTKGGWLQGRAVMDDTGVEELVICPKENIPFKGGYKLVAVISPMSAVDEEDMANGKLISHAPEMLELLSELMSNRSFTSHLPTTALKVNDLIRRATTI